MKNTRTRFIVIAALVAAFYALLTYLSLAFNLAYGPVQFRLSEALTLLPVVSGAAVPGLAVGCLLGNLTSPYGLVDIVCGTCASLLAAVGARLFARVRLRGIPVVSLLMPIVCNAVVVGAEITFLAPEGFALPAFLSAAASVAAGEAAVVVLLGRTGRAAGDALGVGAVHAQRRGVGAMDVGPFALSALGHHGVVDDIERQVVPRTAGNRAGVTADATTLVDDHSITSHYLSFPTR